MAPTYVIHSDPLQEIQLRSGKTLNKTPPAVIIHEETGEENAEKEITEEEEMQIASENTQALGTHSQSSTHPHMNNNPPYPERLLIEKPVVHPQFDLENELKNVCIKIPLLHAIKDVPIYSKLVRELCLKKPGRKQKDPPTIHVLG